MCFGGLTVTITDWRFSPTAWIAEKMSGKKLGGTENEKFDGKNSLWMLGDRQWWWRHPWNRQHPPPHRRNTWKWTSHLHSESSKHQTQLHECQENPGIQHFCKINQPKFQFSMKWCFKKKPMKVTILTWLHAWHPPSQPLADHWWQLRWGGVQWWPQSVSFNEKIK